MKQQWRNKSPCSSIQKGGGDAGGLCVYVVTLFKCQGALLFHYSPVKCVSDFFGCFLLVMLPMLWVFFFLVCQVLQKLGKADETKDVAFEEGVINFNKQYVSETRRTQALKSLLLHTSGTGFNFLQLQLNFQLPPYLTPALMCYISPADRGKQTSEGPEGIPGGSER